MGGESDKSIGQNLQKEIKKTQDSLGTCIMRPVLVDKYLQRPPFRFLHDIVLNVIKETGFLKGVFTPEELDFSLISENVDIKRAFLNKLVTAATEATGATTDIKASKILSGSEPEKTNKLLQILAEGIRLQRALQAQPKKQDVRKAKTKPTITTKKPQIDHVDEHQNSSNHGGSNKIASCLATSSTETKAMKSKSNTDDSTTTKITSIDTNANTKKGYVSSTSSTTSKMRGIVPGRSNVIKNLPSTISNSGETKLKPMKTTGTTGIMKKVHPTLGKKEVEQKSKINLPKDTKSKTFDKNVVPYNTYKTSIIGKYSPRPNRNSGLGLNTTAKKGVIMKKVGESDELDSEKKSKTSLTESGPSSNTDELHNLDSNDNQVDPNLGTNSTGRASGSNTSLCKSAAESGCEGCECDSKPACESASESYFDIAKLLQNCKWGDTTRIGNEIAPDGSSNDQHQNQNQASNSNLAGTTVENTSRPSTARRPAPSRNSQVFCSTENSYRPPEGKVCNVILDIDKTEDLNDEGFVVSEAIPAEAMMNPVDNGGGSFLDGNHQGLLVHQIINTQRELEFETEKKSNMLPEKELQKSREMCIAEIELLKGMIQTIVKNANPLGRFLDFTSQDINSIEDEFKFWRDENSRLDKEIERTEREGITSLQPLQKKLVEIELQIKDKENEIAVKKMNILKCESRISQVMNGLDRVVPSDLEEVRKLLPTSAEVREMVDDTNYPRTLLSEGFLSSRPRNKFWTPNPNRTPVPGLGWSVRRRQDEVEDYDIHEDVKED